MEMLKEIFHRILGDKQREEIRKKAQKKKKNEHEEHYEKMKVAETAKRREEERLAWEEREKEREYHQRRSEHEQVQEDIAEARQKIQSRESKETKGELEKAISQPAPTTEDLEKGKQISGYEKSAFIFSGYENNPYRAVLETLIDENPRIADIIHNLARKDSPVHDEPKSLLKEGRMLLLEVTDDRRYAIQPILDAIGRRVKELIPLKRDEALQTAQEHGYRLTEVDAVKQVLAQIESETEIFIEPEQRRMLLEGQFQEAIDQILTEKPADRPPPSDNFDERRVTPGSLPLEAMKEIDNASIELDEALRRREALSHEKIERVRDAIYTAESKAYPKDIFPGTEAFQSEVAAIHKYSEKKLDELAEILRLNLQQEARPVRTGISDPDEFLRSMTERPGLLGSHLLRNPQMYKLFLGRDEKSYRFRNKIFLQIHSNVLSQKRESSQENFGLYERADFSAFQTLMREGLAEFLVPETGKSIGQTWVEWYTSLSNTIRHSRDIDFWASQPAASMENFNRSLALFQNEYTTQALSIPAVEQAYRAYETALLTIRDTSDGFIPPGLIEYDAVSGTAYWDDSAANILKNMVAQGVVSDAKRDFNRKYGLPVVNKDGISVDLSDKPLSGENMSELELQMYMTLAKGFGMASMRYLEIIANSKIPGVGVPGFSSPVYEGVTIALNFFNVFVKKWQQGAYKYFWWMNSVLPKGTRLPVNAKEALEAHEAYLNGTFKDKYGEKAQRIIDMMNFDRSTGAFSQYTPWRYFDDTKGWTDKQRELMGGPTRIVFAARLAEERVKELELINAHKEEFRERMKEIGRPWSGAEFEKLWQNESPKLVDIDEIWRKMKADHKQWHHTQEKIDAYKRAFKARVWVETAMRNPIAIAHNLEVDTDIPGYNETRKRKLHHLIVEKVLGIPAEDIQFGSVYDEATGTYKVNAAKWTSPTVEQKRYINQVMDLEKDMIAVREMSIKNNRELTEEDFVNVIKDPARVRQAILYWNMVKQEIMGTTEAGAHERIYEKLGLSYRIDPEGKKLEYYDIDWHKIENFKYEKGLGPKAFDTKWLDQEWPWIVETDDTAFRQMQLLNIGGRQWVRRGGDVAAHLAGSQLVAELLDAGELSGPNPDIHKLAEHMLKIRKAYQGDDIAVGWKAVANLSTLLTKFYSFDYAKFKSAAQEAYGTRRNVAAWNANQRRAY